MNHKNQTAKVEAEEIKIHIERVENNFNDSSSFPVERIFLFSIE